MKIKSVKIKNFRNIIDSTLSFNSKTNVISGVNGIGKSNSLNALMWFFTDTLLTDKYGTGENDIASIVPTWYEKKRDPEVTVELVNNTNADIAKSFTKVYRTTYQRGTNIINGHTTEYYVNGVKQSNSGAFNEELYQALNFVSSFNKLKIKEVNAFVDPLYLLQKLDPKELRNFLVAIGCSVSDEELFTQGFEHLRKYKEKYNSKWDLMRRDLKRERDTLLKDIETKEANLEPFANVAEFNDAKLVALKQKQSALMLEKTSIAKGEFQAQIQELELQMKDKAVKINALKAKSEAERNAKLSEKLAQINVERESLETKLSQATSSVQTVLNNSNSNLKQAQGVAARYQELISNYELQAQNAVSAAQSAIVRRKVLIERYNQINSRQFVDFITCPHCGERINIGDEVAFNEAKKHDLEFVANELNQLKKISDDAKSQYDELQTKIGTTKQGLEKTEADISNFKNIANGLKIKLDEIKERGVDKAHLNELQAEYDTLFSTPLRVVGTKELIEEYAVLDVKVKSLKSQDSAKIVELSEKLDEQIEELELQIKEEYVLEANWKKKLEYQQLLKASQEKLNDTEELLGKVCKFIHEMIKRINDKATKKLGIEFRMLEENLTNDGLTEVCYAVINDVPFKDVNTSEKIKWGIKVIEKIKDIAVNDFNVPRNELPIIADRLEAVDTVDKIKDFTTEQFICSRVSNEAQITIIQ